MAGYTNGSTTVGDTRAKVADVAGLVATGQTEVVVFTVYGNVFIVLLRELLDCLLNDLHASWLAHSFGGEIGVTAGTVPVTFERLGVEGNLDAPLLGDTD
jgi:hypothetical protein